MRNIIEILGIILPALIILLSISRIFLKKTKGVNGLIIFSAILLFLVGFIQLFVFKESSGHEPGNKLPALAVSKHSEAFNQSLEKVIADYSNLTNTLAGGDTIAIRTSATALKASLDSFRIDELKVDTLIYETALQPYGNLKAEILSIMNDPSLEEQRASFNLFSNELYSLLRVARYDLAILYWMECPDAFGEDRPGNWLARTEAGNKNPYAKNECSEKRSTIDFVKKDTTNTVPGKPE